MYQIELWIQLDNCWERERLNIQTAPAALRAKRRAWRRQQHLPMAKFRQSFHQSQRLSFAAAGFLSGMDVKNMERALERGLNHGAA